MHREITLADRAFGQQSRSSLYLLTALIGLILLADLWPFVAGWLEPLPLPTWPNVLGGYRIALLAALIGGMRVLYGSLDSLLQGRLGADLALAIACVAAILMGKPVVAAEIVFVGLVGECLENITFERTQRALRQLAELTPKRCWRLRDGVEERVLVSELAVDDLVVVKPGAKVPADGVVTEGRSAVDVSALTGESLPLDKGPGDEILAGSLNIHGSLTIRCQHVAEHTVVGRVVEMTSRALADKAPLERTADRLARYFLPAVLGTAAVTFLAALILFGLGWLPKEGNKSLLESAATPALSVLVVACPCALILATPAAVIAALGRLAGTGILIKGGSALERLASVTAFAFDKTGTLTEGRLELGEVVPLGGISSEELLRLAATAEQGSEHPIARLLVETARERHLNLDTTTDFLAHPGAGVVVQSPTGRLLVGNARLLSEQGVTLTDEARALVERLDTAGQTVLLVCLNQQIVGGIGARDRVRAGARQTIEELRRLGIVHVAMLTGDRPAVARAVADAVGVLEVRAELLPQDKAAFVASWQQGEGGTPPVQAAMVGDGINDAPALARATVGLAIGGSGADVTTEAGDVVLTIGPTGRDPLAHLPLLLSLSRETVRIIRQNIVWFAFAVNVVGIVLTAWLWLLLPGKYHDSGPIAAVIYHQLGSLLVLLNSMRLLWFRRESGPAYLAWVGRFRRTNDWIEKRLDLDAGLHWLAHRWLATTAISAGLLLLGYVASGLYAIQPDEIGLVRRFGRVLDDDLTPGLHWRYPWPIESVTRVKPARVRTIEIGFRSTKGQSAFGPRAWSSRHDEGLSRQSDEAVMITGDGNLLEVQGSVRYSIAEPRRFVFGVAEPEAVIRDAAESALREVSASRGMGDLLTGRRLAFQSEVETRLRDRLPDWLGAKIEGVSLHDLHPPTEVVQSYHEVTRAMELRDRRVNEAHADAIARLNDQKARSEEIVRRAESAKFERVRMAEARRDEFLARYRARTELSVADWWMLSQEAAWQFLAGEPLDRVTEQFGRRREEILAKQEALVDFRLYWDSLTQSLAGRPKLLIDSDKVPTRRTIWLVPFDPPAAPLPIRPQRKGEP